MCLLNNYGALTKYKMLASQVVPIHFMSAAFSIVSQYIALQLSDFFIWRRAAENLAIKRLRTCPHITKRHLALPSLYAAQIIITGWLSWTRGVR